MAMASVRNSELYAPYTKCGSCFSTSAHSAGVAFSINLDTKDATLNSVDLLPGGFTSGGHVGGAVKGFETVIGSALADLIPAPHMIELGIRERTPVPV